MKITKKNALKFAIWEYEQRTGEWEELEDEPDWTVEDQVEQDDVGYWYDSPVHHLATCMFEGHFRNCNKKELTRMKNFFGAKLWQAAMEAYVTGDHDT